MYTYISDENVPQDDHTYDTVYQGSNPNVHGNASQYPTTQSPPPPPAQFSNDYNGVAEQGTESHYEQITMPSLPAVNVVHENANAVPPPPPLPKPK